MYYSSNLPLGLGRIKQKKLFVTHPRCGFFCFISPNLGAMFGVRISMKKNSGLNGIRTHYLCDTGAVEINYQANLSPQFKYMISYIHF